MLRTGNETLKVNLLRMQNFSLTERQFSMCNTENACNREPTQRGCWVGSLIVCFSLNKPPALLVRIKYL